MRFKVADKEYQIEFRRFEAHHYAPDPAENYKVNRRYTNSKPATQVQLLVVDPTKRRGEWEVYREATVKFWKADRFSSERGRIAALREVSRTLDTSYKKAMWECYCNRKKGVQIDRS